MTYRICLDNCAWSALVRNEDRKDLASLREWFELAEAREARIIVPTIVVAEGATKSDEKARTTFLLAMDSKFIELVDLTKTVAEYAGQLRRQTIEANARGEAIRKLKTPDAIIIASAHLAHVNYLLSSDDDIIRMNGMFGLSPIIGPFSTGLPKRTQPMLDLQD